MPTRVIPVIIIGGGPAGMAASVELARQGHRAVILERSRLGGLLSNANLVENYPGFPEGISGVALVERFTDQVKRTGIEVVYEEATSLTYEDGIFHVQTPSRVLRSQAVIIATGTKPLTIDGLAEGNAAADRILHEVYPIREVTSKKIVIIGGGDVAFDYALSLARRNEVAILNRSADSKCCPGLRQMVDEAKSITYKTNVHVVPPVVSSEQGVLLWCQNATGKSEIYADYVVVAVGRTGNVGDLLSKLASSRQRLENENLLQLAGDARHVDFRQTGIAVGGGIMAAMRVARAIEGIS